MCAVEEKSDNTILNERSQKWVSNEEEGEKVTESRKIELQRELCILLPQQRTMLNYYVSSNHNPYGKFITYKILSV